MKQTFHVIYSIYAVIVFFLLAIPILIAYLFLKFLPYEKQIDGVYFLNRILVFLVAMFTFNSFKDVDIELVDFKKTYVVIANHNNLMDLLGSAYGNRISAKPLVKKELGDIPILGQLFQLSSIMVNRSSKDSRKEVLQQMKEELLMGISIMIFPEGTRNRTPNPLKNFYDGAFELSIYSGFPILPIVFNNVRKIAAPDTLLIKPGVIEVCYLPPIYPEGYTMDNLEAYKEKCFRIMENYLIENDDSFKHLKTT